MTTPIINNVIELSAVAYTRSRTLLLAVAIPITMAFNASGETPAERQRIRDRDVIYAASGQDKEWIAKRIEWTENRIQKQEAESLVDEKKRQIFAEFDEWLKQNPPKDDSRKKSLKIKELCGFEFGDSCPFAAPHDLTSIDIHAGVVVPFPPFTTIDMDYGKMEGHPLLSIGFGCAEHGIGVDPMKLTKPNDYEYEAELIRARIEKMYGIRMSPTYDKPGVAYEYNDKRSRVYLLGCNDASKWSRHNGVHPLFLAVTDLELFRQHRYLADRYYKSVYHQYLYARDKVFNPGSSL